jgi:hypothetical protein
MPATPSEPQEATDTSEDFLVQLQMTARPSSPTSPTSSSGGEIDLPAETSDESATTSQDSLVLMQLSLWLGYLQAGMPTAVDPGAEEAGQFANQRLIGAMTTPSQDQQSSLFGSFPAPNGADVETEIPQPEAAVTS